MEIRHTISLTTEKELETESFYFSEIFWLHYCKYANWIWVIRFDEDNKPTNYLFLKIKMI